ncbi:hypothetical protein PLAN_60249 [Planktothrix rubescens CCAP 1459/22]|uniref:Uncharacterized protein n=1 Tax=Planktothrix rubescens CCAP 1459/22 TaxID=329571 RepID=A0A6J7ZS20_PLARU|nr:hypothetical protein PLAN_60249 [Planktothrix rubescens NIVA-CYA 18]
MKLRSHLKIKSDRKSLKLSSYKLTTSLWLRFYGMRDHPSGAIFRQSSVLVARIERHRELKAIWPHISRPWTWT